MKTISIKIILWAFIAFISLPLSAQYTTSFTITELENEELCREIDINIARLLTEFNVAQHKGTLPNISDMGVTAEVIPVIHKLWEDCPFRCADTDVVERAIPTPRGEYQIRNIHLIMMPKTKEQDSWKKYQEAVITVDKKGEVVDFHLAVNPDLYIKVMSGASDVDDFVQRQLILEYVERFRNAYCLKDINFLQQVFSEDALIITGKVITTVKSDVNRMSLNNKKVIYSRQSKKQYLTNLERVFRNNKHINVLFDEIKVVKHPAKENFYGVTLKQGYSSDHYSDEGYVFLLWDFSNVDAPQIHVRTWQPDKIDLNTPLPEEEIFSIDDFDI
jgi:hypothetical protein